VTPNRRDAPRDAPLADGFPAWPIVARIWRTVDVGRTIADLGLAAEELGPDDVLGARGVLVRPDDGPPVAILEPSTEGRLAAALARDAEGDAGVYVAPAGGIDEARRSGLTLGSVAAGPFGRSALVVPPTAGPSTRFVVIVDLPAGTMPR
jgi:hypothetical protein